MDCKTKGLVQKVITNKSQFQSALKNGESKYDWAKICLFLEVPPYKAKDLVRLCEAFEKFPSTK